MENEWGKTVHDLTKSGKAGDAYAAWGAQVTKKEDPLADIEGLQTSMWQRLTQIAEDHNNPGQFTALIGYEWTSTPSGANLHRNVIFRDDKKKADTISPMSVYDF